MNHIDDTEHNYNFAAARESFSGRLLTDTQFDEAMAITGIIEQGISHSGSFKDKLSDYAYAFARTEKFDAVKAEVIIRDLFKERTGQTMNQMREGLAKQEETITDNHRVRAYSQACAIGELMENTIMMSFNRAYAHQARQLARELNVTDACAKRLMREEFKAAEGSDFFDWGKELDETIYRPQIDAEKSRRTTSQEFGQQAKATTNASARAGVRSRQGPQ